MALKTNDLLAWVVIVWMKNATFSLNGGYERVSGLPALFKFELPVR